MSTTIKDQSIAAVIAARKKDEGPSFEDKVSQKRHSQVASLGDSHSEDGNQGGSSAILALLAGLLAELQRLFTKITQQAGSQELKSELAQSTITKAYKVSADRSANSEANAGVMGAIGAGVGAGLSLGFAGMSYLHATKATNGDKAIDARRNALNEHLDVLNAPETEPFEASASNNSEEVERKKEEANEAREDLNNELNGGKELTRKVEESPTEGGVASRKEEAEKWEKRKKYLKSVKGQQKEELKRRLEQELSAENANSQKEAQSHNNRAQFAGALSMAANGMGQSAGTLAATNDTAEKGKEQAAAAQLDQVEKSTDNTANKAATARDSAGQEVQKIADVEEALSKANIAPPA